MWSSKFEDSVENDVCTEVLDKNFADLLISILKLIDLDLNLRLLINHVTFEVYSV